MRKQRNNLLACTLSSGSFPHAREDFYFEFLPASRSAPRRSGFRPGAVHLERVGGDGERKIYRNGTNR